MLYRRQAISVCVFSYLSDQSMLASCIAAGVWEEADSRNGLRPGAVGACVVLHAHPCLLRPCCPCPHGCPGVLPIGSCAAIRPHVVGKIVPTIHLKHCWGAANLREKARAITLLLWLFDQFMPSQACMPEFQQFFVEQLAWQLCLDQTHTNLQAGLLAQKDSWTPCLGVALQVVLNSVGDVLLIRSLAMGLAGAAWATAGSQFAGTTAVLWALLRPGRVRLTSLTHHAAAEQASTATIAS